MACEQGLQVIENSLLFGKLYNHYPVNEKYVFLIKQPIMKSSGWKLRFHCCTEAGRQATCEGSDYSLARETLHLSMGAAPTEP